MISHREIPIDKRRNGELTKSVVPEELLPSVRIQAMTIAIIRWTEIR
jgi:hypothetical protein